MGDKTDAADVLAAVLLGETQALCEILAHAIAVEHLDAVPSRAQHFRDGLADGALAGGPKAGPPDRHACGICVRLRQPTQNSLWPPARRVARFRYVGRADGFRPGLFWR